MAGLLIREALLRATVRRWAAVPCAPHPCGEEVWRYACEAAGTTVSPLPPHRTDRQMAAWLRREGGLIACAGKLVESIGWRPLGEGDAPEAGDVGVIFDPLARLTCAICLGGNSCRPTGSLLEVRWMTKGAGFLRIEQGICAAAWRLPEPPFASLAGRRS